MRAAASGPRDDDWRKIALAGDAGPHFLEAGAAVDGPLQPGDKGHDSLAATHGTGDAGHLPTVAHRPLPSTRRPTAGTALRLVEQALLQVEALLSSSEDELHPTITTGYGLVFQGQFPCPPWQVSRLSEGPPGGEAGSAGDRRGRSPASGLPTREGSEEDQQNTAGSEDACKSRAGHGAKYRPVLRQKSSDLRVILARFSFECLYLRKL
jgi:hypothetical protein